MDVKELRIGNLITLDSLEIFVEPIDIESLNNPNTPLFNEKYKPIPLTEEWLLKFGFEYDANYLCYEGNKMQIELDFGDRSRFYFDTDYGETDLKHVHSLQNLYFALTNKELTIK